VGFIFLQKGGRWYTRGKTGEERVYESQEE